MGHLSSYHVYSQRFGHLNVKNGLFLVFSAEGSKHMSQFGQNISVHLKGLI